MKNFLSILQKKHTFSIFHTHFYKTPTSICLFYTVFYLNNIFLTFFLLFHTYPWPTNFNTHTNCLWTLSLSFLILLLSFFIFFFLLLPSLFEHFPFHRLLLLYHSLNSYLSLSIFPIPLINLPQFTATINQTQSKAEAQINTKTKPTHSIINSNKPTKFSKLEHQLLQTHKSPLSLKPNKKRKNLDCVGLDYGFV